MSNIMCIDIHEVDHLIVTIVNKIHQIDAL